MKWLAVAGLTGLGMTTVAVAQTSGEKLRLSAVAIDMDRGHSTPLRIAIDRWSTDAEREKLMKVMMTQGADKLLDVLRDMRPIGTIRSTTSLAWDLHFSHRMPGKDGGDRIILATDRPISLGEAWYQSRRMDYPFTVLEVHLPTSGEGDGTMSFATKVIPDEENNVIVLENFGLQRIRLTQVRREKD
jgi:hypothetical protein